MSKDFRNQNGQIVRPKKGFDNKYYINGTDTGIRQGQDGKWYCRGTEVKGAKSLEDALRYHRWIE